MGFQIVYDRVTDRSRGFGFVTMGSVEEAQEAIKMFDGSVSTSTLSQPSYCFIICVPITFKDPIIGLNFLLELKVKHKIITI